jgi:uncharacterized protein YecE (DUF72 family)
MPLFVGTSGWQYRHWRDVFYPPGLPQRSWLEYYATRYVTVESNAAFYRLPSYDTFRGWRDRMPPGFLMAVKASRYLTHVRRLRDPEEPVRRMLTNASGLGDRLGPILLQLPPTFRADADLLDACLGCFPAAVRVAVEPRHDSWWTAEIRGVLERRGAALCWADRGSRPITPLWRTAGWGYVRFHEGRARPRPRYGRTALATWATRIAQTWPDIAADADVFAYFNNDPGGAAIHDADAFIRLAERAAAGSISVAPGPA